MRRVQELLDQTFAVSARPAKQKAARTHIEVKAG
jgi:hypothetical protein